MRNIPFESTSPLAPVAQLAGDVPVFVLLDAAGKPRTSHAGALPLPPSFTGKPGQLVELPAGDGVTSNGGDPARLFALGIGEIGKDNGEAAFWRAAGGAIIDAARKLRIDSLRLSGDLLPVGIAQDAAAGGFALGVALAAHTCVQYRATPPKDHFAVRAIGTSPSDWTASERGRLAAESVNWARALVEAPANVLTPAAFAEQARLLATLGVEVQVLDQAALESLGTGGLLAVGRSSENAPCMVLLEWRGRPAADASEGVDLGLVGKGLTFDGGGLNLKPGGSIEKMKFDMAGAAAVAGAIRLLAARKAPINVAAAIPLCENIIDGTSYRPGDVITSLAGLTIEVANTDAEGRIVVADGMTHLIRTRKPRFLVDVATLTGSIMGFLHEEYAGLFATDDALAAHLEAAGKASGDELWRMPMSGRYDYLVESEIADVRNLGAPGMFANAAGSAIAGAKFLQRFAGETAWAHVDIAGVAWATRPRGGVAKGATGFGVQLLDALASEVAGRTHSER